MSQPTLKERVEILHLALLTFPAHAEHLLEGALREQDKLTRHACAEAVNNLPRADPTDTVIHAWEAHQACMNARTL